MADMGKTETTATQEDIVSALVQAELSEKGVLFNTVSDYTSQVTKGAKSVGIPKSDSFTAADKVENTSGTNQALTLSVDSLDLNIFKHVPVKLEDDAADTVIDIESEIVKRQVTAIVRAIESSLAGVIVKASNDIQLSGTDNLVLTAADILSARQALNEANVPMDDRFLAVPPAQEAAMLALDNFVDASKYGSNDAIVNGEIGKVYGFRVVVSNSFASDAEFSAYHRSHVAFALGQQLKVESQRAPLADLATEYSVSIRYGAKQLDSGNRGIFADDTATS